jgi:hypothetical protein
VIYQGSVALIAARFGCLSVNIKITPIRILSRKFTIVSSIVKGKLIRDEVNTASMRTSKWVHMYPFPPGSYVGGVLTNRGKRLKKQESFSDHACLQILSTNHQGRPLSNYCGLYG